MSSKALSVALEILLRGCVCDLRSRQFVRRQACPQSRLYITDWRQFCLLP